MTSRRLINQRYIKVLSHPLRNQIMAILIEGPSSPSRIAKRLDGASLNLVSHHVKELEAVGCVKLIETVEKKGRRPEHIYEATTRPSLSAEEWALVDPAQKGKLTGVILDSISEDVETSISHGVFEELPDNHLSRSILKVDGDGWSTVVKVLKEALEKTHKAHEESVERACQSGEELMPIRVAMMQFPMPKPPSGTGE